MNDINDNDSDSERPTIPSPPGSTEVRGGKEYLVAPACTYIFGCTTQSMRGSTRCRRHSSMKIPTIKSCSRCRELFAPDMSVHHLLWSPMCPKCQTRNK